MLDFMTSNVLMPIGALTFSIFVGWILKRDGLYILFSGFISKTWFEIWYFALRYVAPIAIIAIGVYQLINKLN